MATIQNRQQPLNPLPMSEVKTKEQILESKADSRYNIGMPFHFSHIYEAMDEYSTQQNKSLQERVEELEEGLREFLSYKDFSKHILTTKGITDRFFTIFNQLLNKQ